MACCRSYNQFNLLMYKNWLLQKRKKISTIFIVFIPIIFVIVLVVLRATLSSEYISSPTTEPPFDVKSNLNDLGLEPPPGASWVLAYTPNTPLVQDLMKSISASLNITFDQNYGFNNEIELQNNITAFNKVFGGIVFQNGSFLDGNWTKKLTYKIRLRAEQYEGSQNSRFIPSSRRGWLTNLLMPTTTINGPRQPNTTKGGKVPGYYNEGFLSIKQVIDEYFIEKLNENPKNIKSYLKKFPYPPYLKDNFVFILQTQFPFIIMLSFIVIVPTICSDVTSERESKLKEAMKLMGLKGWLNWAAWFTKYLILMIFIVSFMTLFFHIKVEGASIITYTHFTITFVFLFLYTLDITIFCFWMTTFFEKASTAAAAGTIIFFFTYIPEFFLYFQYDAMKLPVRNVVCLVFNLAMAQGCRTIAKFEEIGVGVQWSTLNRGPNENETFSMANVFVFQLIDIVLYGFLTWYVDTIKPGEFGTAEPWYFLVSPKYWRKKCCCNRAMGQGYDLSLNETPDYGEKKDFFEPFPKSFKIGIKIRNLTKKFKKMKVPAVDGISLDMKEGDITALLGHNGAGKTTTMSMLTGFIPVTSGTATINGYEITQEMEEIRRSLGLCPQFNILFDTLTVREHLYFFALLKGCSKDHVNTEVEVMMRNVNLQDKENVASKFLSGGMKRRLCVGIALIAGSKFVILDEPSSGLDPEARREMWEILKEQKKGRTIILSTHYMDEADYLGDRIAIMADGRLYCSGSPMFLKKQYGVGYHMALVKTKDCKPEIVNKVIHDIIPSAKLESNIGAEMSYVLPKEKSAKFSELFSLFEEKGKEIGVASFGASVTTIEEVFIKVKKESEDATAILEQQSLKDKDQNGPKDLDTEPMVLTGFSKENRRKKGILLNLQKLQAMFIKRMLNTWRNRIIFVTQILVPIIATILAVLVTKSIPKQTDPPARKLEITEYKDSQTYYSTLFNDISSDEIKTCLEKAIKGAKEFIGDKDLEDYLIEKSQNNLYLFRNRYQVAVEIGKDNITGFYNDESYHTISMSQSLINNARLVCETNDHNIETINHPLPWSDNSKATLDSETSRIVSFMVSLLLMLGMAFLTATFIVFLIQERTSGAKNSQYVSGVTTPTFWLATFIWDYINYLIPALLVIIVILISQTEGYTHENNAGYLFLTLLMYGFGCLPSMYLLSFFFKTAANGYGWSVVLNFFTGAAATIVILILKNPSFMLLETSNRIEWLFYVIFPNFCFGKAVQDIYANYQNFKTCSELKMSEVFCDFLKNINRTAPCCIDNCGDICLYRQDNYLSWYFPGIGRSLVFLALQGIFFSIIVIIIESDIYMCIKSSFASNIVTVDAGSAVVPLNETNGHLNNGTNHHNDTLKRMTSQEFDRSHQKEDSDVKHERDEVLKTELKDLRNQEAVLLIKELTKVYSGDFVAVDKLCLKVYAGECFGLLGVNGAGKTSTFKMMTGDETISGGGIYINGINVAKNLGKTREFFGYCPQFDALVDQLTTEENLKMHARLRGMYSADIKEVSECLMKSLMLYQYKDRQAGALSGGNKRKLGIAIALIGNPLLVFLDEPTAGMDPVARRELWNCVASLKQCGTTVILTSHSMEDCEALCTRLAIMVNGQFKCLGSFQHLKSKFGSGYSLALKGSSEKNMAKLTEFMNYHYPEAFVEFQGDLMISYRIAKNLPNASLGKIFELIEIHKQSLNLEDYSVSQTSLEQVFMNFAKTQLKESRRTKKKFACCKKETKKN